MNLKMAKALRGRAEELMAQWVRDKILSPEQTEGRSNKQLLAAIPPRIHFRDNFRRFNGVGTQRWFYRIVKKQPEISYEQILSKIYPNQEGSDDGRDPEEGSRSPKAL